MPYCRNCGAGLLPADKFCANCGQKVVGITKPVELPSMRPASSPAPSQEVPSMQYASLAQRIVAYLVDWLITATFGFAITFLSFGSFYTAALWNPSLWISSGYLGPFLGLSLVLGLLGFLYQCGFLATSGQTPGKMVAKVKVVKEDGRPCDWAGALIRTLLIFVDALPGLYIIGVLLIASSSKRQRLGDIVARTIVIRLE